MLDRMVLIPYEISKGLKFLDIEIADVVRDGMSALQSLSEIDKGKITGLYSDFLDYLHTDNVEECTEEDISMVLHGDGDYLVIVLDEEIDFDSLTSANQIFKTVCVKIVNIHKGDDFDIIPSAIVKRVI